MYIQTDRRSNLNTNMYPKEHQFIYALYDICYDRYKEYDIVVFQDVFPNPITDIVFTIHIFVNNKRHELIKHYDRWEFKRMSNAVLVDLIKELIKEIDSMINNLKNKPTTEDTSSNNNDGPLIPLKCPCCNANITNKHKCEYCDTRSNKEDNMDFTKNMEDDSIRCIWCGSKQPEDSHNENMTDIKYICDKCKELIKELK